ncbi:hypothetical protein [Marinicella meishanensis]|uniref:hypothetical protein n=1 Tax=Marinicella meishanensis TaxID=2873263 RepID=UPI001CBC420A|nr:hypothetical protein [Marinicella sp. NBU2979]
MELTNILNTRRKKITFLVVVLLLITQIYSWYLLSSGSWYNDPGNLGSYDGLSFKTCLQFDRKGLFMLKADIPGFPNSLPSGILVLNSVKLASENGKVRFFVNPFTSTLSATVTNPKTLAFRSQRFVWQTTKCQSLHQAKP